MNNLQEYFQHNPFDKIIQILLIVGAINWGLVTYNGVDIVRSLAQTVNYTPLDRYLKLTVGIAGVYMLYKLIMVMVSGTTSRNKV